MVQDRAHCVSCAVALLLILVFVLFSRHEVQIKGIWGSFLSFRPSFPNHYLRLATEVSCCSFYMGSTYFSAQLKRATPAEGEKVTLAPH